MKIIEWKVPEDYSLWLVGDSHEGTVLQDKTGFQKIIQRVIDEKNAFMIHMGDEIEGFWVDDPRYGDMNSISSPIEQQRNVIEDMLPLAKSKKLLGILYGNHSHKLSLKVGNITEDTCKRLGVHYCTFSCVVHFYDRHGIQWKGYFTHGKRQIYSVAADPLTREANMQLQLKRHLKEKMGCCILMAKGHTHKLIVAEPSSSLYLVTHKKIKQHYTSPAYSEDYIPPDQRWYVNTGSFLKAFVEGVTGYPEMSELDPVELGCIRVEVLGRKIANVNKVKLGEEP